MGDERAERQVGRPPGVEEGEDGLTGRQREVLGCIAESIRERGYAPSMREIGEKVGLASTSSVTHQVRMLERKGFLRRDPTRPRTYVPVDRALTRTADTGPGHADDATADEEAPPVVHAPLVGRIPAGTPSLVEQHVEDVLALPRQIVGAGEYGDLVVLTVSGCSMVRAHILDGDQVVIRLMPDCVSGDIVAAMIDGEATIKRLKRSGSQVWLMPENEAFQPLDGTYATVLGKVTAVLRRL
ncbi:transcriptional repressor LexA [Streptomyces europaeiscabiei]|uniref:transcriptional repressor LexA n=1 Tax=Streptomyces europaeiscabiei TaxID=146819 RepID=UPI0029A63E60|nr:transcriptional repressor LexA [Streptomyces europaeiscabiei]MDX3694853.1 transcriptional repressor LexA [Streptomyces europaeiscabiei]